MRSIIVGTAGHIDHGKTSLVRALTGVDADRLPEEKRRGITIDLGFAELDLGDLSLGFVDVPGHERFVRNMLAGAHGIDLVALVIAADEGVMPQTREHFDICRLLETKAGLVVITKADMVDEELLALVRAEAEELVAGSFLEGAPVVTVSSRTGHGLEELRSALHGVAASVPARPRHAVARLPVDRAFTMRGFGAVVTGTLVAGEIAEGDELELLPGGWRVRARGVQVHGQTVQRAEAGQRTAVNLGGVEASLIERGMVLAPAGRLRPTQIMDVQLDVLKSAPRSLRSRSRVRLHLGAAEVLGRIRVLSYTGEIAPGESGFAQLRLESPVVALPAERFIIRSYSPSRTVAGGTVLDSFALKHRGREAGLAHARLASLSEADDGARLAYFVETSAEAGASRSDLQARTGWRDEVLERATAEAVRRGMVVEAENVLIARASFEALAQSALAEVEAFHKREPLARGCSRETLRERHFAHAAPEIFRAVISHLEGTGALVAEKEVVRATSHSLSLSAADAALKDRLERIYSDAGLEPPTFDEALQMVAAPMPAREHGRKILQLLIEGGLIVRVGAELFFHRDALERLKARLARYGSEHEPERLIDVAAFKEMAGVSRKYAIPLLEYFDRERVTRRAGDKRLIL
ncbi:MAG TPA: selenocysteine-specific translation elongation factor [Pyrinomonadaceae bacterium]|jgi:selenocysteine-specific elongation factor|nr:selenocysteine-specific translation elongation factor [Pyrinomonadaceae bacterium]